MPRTSLKKGRQLVAIPPDVLISGPREVRAYLRKHHDLAKVVPTVCQQVRKEFGDEADLCLQMKRDPEIDNEYLALVVRANGYSQDFMKRIETLSRAFDDELTNSAGWFHVMTDFRVPQERHGV